MSLYEEMRIKKPGNVVRVYDITDGMATIFNPEMYYKVNNGWMKVKASNLVPIDFPINSADSVSKTKKNKAKERMTLVDAVWRTSDGIDWQHCEIEEAILHEISLMEAECFDNNEEGV